jgi:small conductance mechanosensitive channel
MENDKLANVAGWLSPDRMAEYADTAMNLAIEYVPSVLLAIIVLIVGLWLIQRVVGLLRRTLEGRQADATLARFLCSLTSVGLKALLLISVASMVGIETTSFVALIGAAGLAIGLALQGSLSNFAGGVLVLLFKPYRVGDFVEAQGVSGTVADIQIFNTVLKTPDNKVIIVPNGAISNGVITNYSMEDTRRVDMLFGIGYDDDIRQARSVISGLIDAEERILREPGPLVVVSELADSSVNFTVRVWVASGDYWGVYFDLTERVKVAFDAAGISIPYPQTDVHLHRQGVG